MNDGVYVEPHYLFRLRPEEHQYGNVTIDTMRYSLYIWEFKIQSINNKYPLKENQGISVGPDSSDICKCHKVWGVNQYEIKAMI